MTPSLIVHPVSWSTGGKAALGAAVALARFWNADLHLVEFRGRRHSGRQPIVRSLGEREVEPHLAEFVRSVNGADVRISVVELGGDVVDGAADYARSTSADLVIVADRARSHGPYWRSGKYANDLAHRLSSPLLAFPATRTAESIVTVPFRSVLCWSDFSPVSLHALEHALDVAGTAGARVTLLQTGAFRPNDEASEMAGLEYEILVRPGPIADSLVRTAEEIEADLIVIAQPHRNDRVSMRSLLLAVLRQARCPVLVAPAADPERLTSRDPASTNAALSHVHSGHAPSS
jgi:nucleotide-binding universal stress UspA family protein